MSRAAPAGGPGSVARDWIVLGTAQIGLPYGRRAGAGLMSAREAEAILARAWDMGIRAFDTAESYGEAAARLADWLRENGRGASASVVNKVIVGAGDVAAGARAAIERFRHAAGVLLLSHGAPMPAEWDTLLRVAEPTGVPVGQSVYRAWEIVRALGARSISRIQAPGNIFDETAIAERARRGGSAVPLDLRSIFLQGTLLEPADMAERRGPGTGRLAAAVAEAARAAGAEPAPLLIAAVRRRLRPGDRIVLGADHPGDLLAIERAEALSADAVTFFVERVRALVPGPVSPLALDPRTWTSHQREDPQSMHVVAIIQARTTSTRLPGKVLAPIGEWPMVERLLRQLRGCRSIHASIVATSDDPSDDELARRLTASGYAVARGPLDDVLERMRLAADAAEADVIVRLTGDCPLHTPDTIDEVVEAFLGAGVEYANNVEPYTRPNGLDVEVFTRDALERAAREATAGPDREHVTPYLRRAPDVRRLYFMHRDDTGASLRWTVDIADDLEYARRIWRELDARGPGPHRYEDVLAVASRFPRKGEVEVVNLGYYKSLFAEAPDAKAKPLSLARSEEWLERSARVIPGGAQTYSKSVHQHIRGVTPIFLERGAGARVWDVDGNEYVDLIQGLLPNILGYAHPEVDRAAHERTRLGHSFSLAHPLEVELAERLAKLFPCAEQVRFGKNGSDATAGAVRIARAFTGRERVLVCGYHGWQDWYIGVTTRTAGVPRGVRDLVQSFPYNDLEALERLLVSRRGEVAAVIMEPFNFWMPAEGYLEGVKRLAHEHGALLIFDEICTGFHFGPGGAQRMFGVVPDMATFGKGMGNGYAISCVAGRRDVMRTFEDAFVSFTFAGEVAAMAASLAVLDILEHTDAYARMESAGRRLAEGAAGLAEQAGLSKRFVVQGHHRWPLLRFLKADGTDDPLLRAVWIQEVTRRGVLILNTHNLCAALDTPAVEHVLRGYAAAFRFVGGLVARGEPLERHLDGPIPQPAFRARG